MKLVSVIKKRDLVKAQKYKKPFILDLTQSKWTSIQPSDFYRNENVRMVLCTPQMKVVSQEAFAGARNLTRFDGAPQIVGNAAFAFCSSLQDFNFNQVLSIEPGAFAHSGLKAVNLGPGLKTIGNSAFQFCLDLEDVNLGNVETIEHHAFACTKLMTVVINSPLKRIGNKAFEACTYLNSLVCLTSTPPRLCESSFSGANIKNIWVPDEKARQAFCNARYWSEYADCIKVIDWTEVTDFVLKQTKDRKDAESALMAMYKCSPQ